MNRIVAANVVVAGYVFSNDTVNEPSSVSVSLVKTYTTEDMDDG